MGPVIKPGPLSPEHGPGLTTPSPIDEVGATYFYTHRCQSVERECACCCEFFSLWCSGHKRTIKNQGRALGEWVRELGPNLPVTRYCLLGGVARGVALDIFTMNGSLSVDVKRLALRILLDCCCGVTEEIPLAPYCPKSSSSFAGSR